jgi:hypothetical protein
MAKNRAVQLFWILLLWMPFWAACSLWEPDEEREEYIAGVAVPIPAGLYRSTEKRVELTLPGVEGGEVSFAGRVDPRDVVRFYQKEMPARGWTSKGSLVSEGGALAYTRDNRSVLIRIGRNNGQTVVSILAGGLGS